ncbi:MAG: NUDIX domain-containing protein [Candidatus Pacebacteria bacterium]|nr:NUDIX domain-containing protein [Candidatus Paceibacterota bacterium]MDD4201811.1 NUDIX domain-containing protein [Candidatus Paceibacterota bacterium]MDD4467473.1 NUDIX domain-containing protein [Candidatus Paceibacterota bacterium]MDD5445919.1 NUDIX domain-containing protein [Candidatus Paceibacterota bacterium]
MLKELSFGAVLFRVEKGKIYYLLLQHSKNYFNFPKGGLEKDEGAIRAAKREILEETGIKDVKIIKGFKEKNNYIFRQKGKLIFKTVIFFLAQTKEEKVTISKEHIGYKWLSYEDATSFLRIKDLKKILKKADDFLKSLQNKSR